MSYHIKYTSKDEFYGMAAKKFNTWLAQLTYVEQKLNKLSVMTEFQGATADAVKSYFFDVHGTLLLGLRQAIQDFYCRLAFFAYGYYNIDGAYSAVLPEEALLDVKAFISDEENYISEEIADLSGVLTRISDILSLSTPNTADVFAAMGDMKGQIDQLGIDIQNYEASKQAEANGDLANLLASISNVIKSRSGAGGSISSYRPGSCFSDASIKELKQNVAVSAQNTEAYKSSINDIVDELGPFSGEKGQHTLIPPNLAGINDVEGREHITMDELVQNGTIPALIGAVMGSVGITKVSGSGVVEKTDKSIQGAVKYGQTGVEYDVLGLDVKDTYYGDVIGGSAKYDIDFGFNLKADDDGNFDKEKIEVEAVVKGEAEGHVATGKVSTSSQYHEGNLGGTVLTGGVEGEVGFSIIDDGKFSPSIGAGVSAEGAVVEGSADLRLGDEDNNVHGKAEGTLLGAEAGVEASAGKIRIKDKATGQESTIIGVKGGAKAEAYLAEGRVSGGFELFGVKFDIGLEGKAGGAGAGVGGYAGTGGVSGELDVGLGLGIGLDFSIDWSGFKLPW